MLNTNPIGGGDGREDLPLFPQTALISANAGTYFISAQGTLVTTVAEAAKLDNSGNRWVRGFKLFSSVELTATQLLSVVPCVSEGEGAFDPISFFDLALTGTEAATNKRNYRFVQQKNLYNLKDNSVLVYRVLLPKKLAGIHITATLYLF